MDKLTAEEIQALIQAAVAMEYMYLLRHSINTKDYRPAGCDLDYALDSDAQVLGKDSVLLSAVKKLRNQGKANPGCAGGCKACCNKE